MTKSFLTLGLILTVTQSVFAISAVPVFDDIDFDHENYQAIEYVKNLGMVEGYSDQTYKPFKTINRAEFTKIIMGAQFSASEISNCNVEKYGFSDVEKNAWFAPYICIAKVKDIIGGYPDGTFKPAKEIQFTEASKIISQTFGYQTQATNLWYEPFISALESRGAIPNSINELTHKITRGEMAEIIFRLKKNNSLKPEKNQSIIMKTSLGDIKIKLFTKERPKTTENFIGLTKKGKYNGTIFHRVIDGFMIQGGDYENFNGTGGQSIWGGHFDDEFYPKISNKRGMISMANAGPNTNGAQFFIVQKDAPFLDGKHSVFGQVVSGMDVVDKIARAQKNIQDKPLKDIKILSISVE